MCASSAVAAAPVERREVRLCALRRECACRQPNVTGERVTILATGKCVCRLSARSPTVAAPRGKKCPLYQEGGARDVR